MNSFLVYSPPLSDRNRFTVPLGTVSAKDCLVALTGSLQDLREYIPRVPE